MGVRGTLRAYRTDNLLKRSVGCPLLLACLGPKKIQRMLIGSFQASFAIQKWKNTMHPLRLPQRQAKGQYKRKSGCLNERLASVVHVDGHVYGRRQAVLQDFTSQLVLG